MNVKQRQPKLTAYLGIRLDADLHDFVVGEADKLTKSNVNKYIRKLIKDAKEQQNIVTTNQ